MASSFDKPFCIALQNFFEKFLEILFCKRLTVGSEVCEAKEYKGFKKELLKIKKKEIYTIALNIKNCLLINKYIKLNTNQIITKII